MLASLYNYQAKLVRVVDGDTLEVDLDMGFKTWKRVFLRLQGINCPESRGETKVAGLAARDFVVKELPPIFLVQSNSLDKYGRSIANIWYQIDSDWFNLSQVLVDNNHAELIKY